MHKESLILPFGSSGGKKHLGFDRQQVWDREGDFDLTFYFLTCMGRQDTEAGWAWTFLKSTSGGEQKHTEHDYCCDLGCQGSGLGWGGGTGQGDSSVFSPRQPTNISAQATGGVETGREVVAWWRAFGFVFGGKKDGALGSGGFSNERKSNVCF